MRQSCQCHPTVIKLVVLQSVPSLSMYGVTTGSSTERRLAMPQAQTPITTFDQRTLFSIWSHILVKTGGDSDRDFAIHSYNIITYAIQVFPIVVFN